MKEEIKNSIEHARQSSEVSHDHYMNAERTPLDDSFIALRATVDELIHTIELIALELKRVSEAREGILK